MVDIVVGDIGNGDMIVFGCVDRVFFSQFIYFFWGYVSVGEYVDLGGDVVLVVFGVKFFEVFFEEGVYGDDVVSYVFDFVELLFVEGWVVEDFGGDVGIVNWGVGDYGMDDDFELGVDVFDFVGISVDEGEGIDMFVVEILLLIVSNDGFNVFCVQRII